MVWGPTRRPPEELATSGDDDEVGALSDRSADQVRAAARLSRSGKAFTLQVPTDPAAIRSGRVRSSDGTVPP